MNGPTLLRGVGIAVILSLVAAAGFALFRQVADPAFAIRLVVALTTAGYLIWLVPASGVRIGRVTTAVAWFGISLGLWLATPSFALFLLGHVALLWIVRSLYFHSGVLPAAADLGLSALALGGALWASEQTGSLLLATWSFYLVQAFFVLIPQAADRPERAATEINPSQFNRSRRTAEAALRRISASH